MSEPAVSQGGALDLYRKSFIEALRTGPGSDRGGLSDRTGGALALVSERERPENGKEGRSGLIVGVGIRGYIETLVNSAT